MVLKSGKSKTKMLVDSGSMGCLFSASKIVPSCCPFIMKTSRALHGDLALENGVPKIQFPKDPLFNTINTEYYVPTYKFGATSALKP